MATTHDHDNTINFMYFLTNHSTNDFVLKIWTNYLGAHFQSKFLYYVEKHKSTKLAIIDLFFELDRDNQRIFLDWINKNYSSFSDLKL
jgi:hypothetical protein